MFDGYLGANRGCGLVTHKRHAFAPAALLVGFFLAGCAALSQPAQAQSETAAPGTTSNTDVVTITPFSAASNGQPPQPWRVVGIPGGKIPLTAFAVVALSGAKVLRVEAIKSYGNLVHAVPGRLVPATGQLLRWRWRLDQPLPAADLARKDGDDSPIKVCALFDQPLAQLSLLDRTLLRLARSASAESLPSATLCYVWDSKLPVGTVLANAYTARVRLLVVDGGEQRLGQWSSHARDVAQDFRRAFADAQGQQGQQTQQDGAATPPLTAILVGADADNTAGASLAFVGDVSFGP